MNETIIHKEDATDIRRCAKELLDFISNKYKIETIDGFECQYMKNLAKAIDWTKQ